MTPGHAKPRAGKDRLLPALVLIVACGLLEVWASWLTIASVSGFPKLGPMTTGWILPVTTEAYWTAALFAWLVDPAGVRSCRFAMWTAVIVFAFSLTGQELSHLVAAAHSMPSAFAVGLVTALPLIAVGLGAILIHFRHADREEAAREAEAKAAADRLAAITRAEADERTALRAQAEALGAELESVRAELAKVSERAADAEAARAEAEVARSAMQAAEAERDEARTGLEAAIARAEAAVAKAERLERRLGGPKRRSASGTGSRKIGPKTGTRTAPEDDLTLEARALDLLATDLSMSGAELARRLGVTEGYGRKLRRRLTDPDRPSEAAVDRAEDRGGTASQDRAEDRGGTASQDRAEDRP